MKLIDTFPFKYQLVEDSSGDGKPQRVRGVFQRADERNANGRIYSRKLWEKILESKDFNETISRRRMIGEVDHPGNSELRLSEAAIVITGLSLKENNEIVGEFELLPTAPGKHLEALMSAGVEFGISSRGEGSVYEKNGETYIGEDYKCITFDVVANPSTRGAYPTLVKESISSSTEEKNPVSAKLKLENLSNQVQSIKSVNLTETTTGQRNDLAKQAQTILTELGSIVNEDSSLQFTANSLATALTETIGKLSSTDAPPALEAQLQAAYSVIDETINQTVARERKILRVAKSRITESNKKASARITELQTRLRRAVNENLKLRRKVAIQEEVGDNLLREFNKLKESKGSVRTNDRRSSIVERIRARREQKRLNENGKASFVPRRKPLNETTSTSIIERFNGGGKRVARTEAAKSRPDGAKSEQRMLAESFASTLGGRY